MVSNKTSGHSISCLAMSNCKLMVTTLSNLVLMLQEQSKVLVHFQGRH